MIKESRVSLAGGGRVAVWKQSNGYWAACVSVYGSRAFTETRLSFHDAEEANEWAEALLRTRS